MQKRHLFRIKNKERGHFMSIQGGVEEMKSGRVVVTPEVEPMSDIWFYQDGIIKNKVIHDWNVIILCKWKPEHSYVFQIIINIKFVWNEQKFELVYLHIYFFTNTELVCMCLL